VADSGQERQACAHDSWPGVMCPAVPEVGISQAADGKIHTRLGFDGSKLDNIYSVPACYNPAHHHKSPQDSVNAMGMCTRNFPDDACAEAAERDSGLSVRHAASLAWLPFIDQA